MLLPLLPLQEAGSEAQVEATPSLPQLDSPELSEKPSLAAPSELPEPAPCCLKLPMLRAVEALLPLPDEAQPCEPPLQNARRIPAPHEPARDQRLGCIGI